MARMTVTVEGEANEVRGALEALLGSVVLDGSGEALGKGQSVAGGQKAAQSPWTPDDLGRLWSILTPNAKRVLATVAQEPDGYAHQDLERVLETDMQTIGGNLSSVGHAMRRLYSTDGGYLKPWPIDNDYAWRRYRMDKDVAKMIRDLWDVTGDSNE